MTRARVRQRGQLFELFWPLTITQSHAWAAPFSSMNSTPTNLSPFSLGQQFDLGCTQYDINMDCIIRENDQAIVPVQDTTVKQRMYIAVDGFNIAMNSACDFPNSQW